MRRPTRKEILSYGFLTCALFSGGVAAVNQIQATEDKAVVRNLDRAGLTEAADNWQAHVEDNEHQRNGDLMMTGFFLALSGIAQASKSLPVITRPQQPPTSEA